MIAERTQEVAKLYWQYATPPAGGQGQNGHSPKDIPPSRPFDLKRVDDLLNRMLLSKSGPKIKKWIAGDWSGYGSQSEADLAAAGDCVWWAGGDLALADALFRSFGLYRPDKWDKVHYADGRTYGEATLQRALSHMTSFYTGEHDEQDQSEPTPDRSGDASEQTAAEVVALRHQVALLKLELRVRDNPYTKQQGRTLIALCREILRRVKRGKADDRGFVAVPAVAIVNRLQRANKKTKINEGTVSRHSKLGDVEAIGLYERETRREEAPPGSPQPYIKRTYYRPLFDRIEDVLTVLADYEGVSNWGGRRQWRCMEHPNAKIKTRVARVCANCGGLAVLVDTETGEIVKRQPQRQ